MNGKSSKDKRNTQSTRVQITDHLKRWICEQYIERKNKKERTLAAHFSDRYED